MAAEGVVALANALTPSLAGGRPGDVVAGVHYLIAAPFQNGSVLAVDGGITSSYLPTGRKRCNCREYQMEETIQSLVSLITAAKRSLYSSDSTGDP